VREATTKPLNVLAHPRMTMSDIADAGGQRVSLGGWFAFVAVTAMADAAEHIRDSGDFSVLRTDRRISEWLGG
jgi:2-methylisocitrate lyase-like PEP mutase family enzyme